MKKTILASLVAILAAGSAVAGTSVSLGYSDVEATSTGAQSHRLNLGVKTTVGNALSADFGVSTTRNDTTGALSQRTEVGIGAPLVSFGRFGTDVRVATGAKMVSGSDTKYYYSIEPGVNVALTDRLSARVAYRFRDAYASDVADRSNTNRVGVSYALTKADKVGLSYDKVRGDGAEKAVTLGYTRSF